MGRWLGRLALAATLVLPVFLMHGRAVAEVVIGVIDFCFLARCLLAGEWAGESAGEWDWLRTAWVKLAAIWWGWLILCSLPSISGGGTGPLIQAVGLARFLVLVAALENDVLRPAFARRWMARAVMAAALYIGLQSLLQFATGHNLQGFPRGADGELTGPFQNPRAAAPLSRLMFPAILAGGGVAPVLGLAVLATGTMVLIGQRMPLLLTMFGLVLTGFLLPRMRLAMLGALVAGGLLLGASAVVAPQSFYRLVTKFSTQIENFADSEYGRIATRAIDITRAHPVFGQGFDAYRRTCADPVYGLPNACNIHPHNHYLEAATESGIPGLLLFSALIVAWLRPLARGLRRDPNPLRVGLFVTAFISEWPIASSNSFTSIELGGFFFVLLGYGLAEARAATSSTVPSTPTTCSTAPGIAFS